MSDATQRISREEFDSARAQRDAAEKVIEAYCRQEANDFEERLRTNPIFTDEELTYSARDLCPCGHGLAYPKGCSPHHYWDCSAILKGIEDKSVTHTARLPFSFYEIKSENQQSGCGTTRGVFRPKVATEVASDSTVRV